VVGAELFGAVFAEEDDGEVVGVDVEAAAGGGLVGIGYLADIVIAIEDDAPGFVVLMQEERDADDISLVHWYAALGEDVHLCDERMRRGRRED
jgi:hypothetical protein